MSNRKPNSRDEFLIDVQYSWTHPEVVFVYDLTCYFPVTNNRDRKRYLNKIAFSVEGKRFTVHIIDFWEQLTDESARRIASMWYSGDTTTYRLD